MTFSAIPLKRTVLNGDAMSVLQRAVKEQTSLLGGRLEAAVVSSPDGLYLVRGKGAASLKQFNDVVLTTNEWSGEGRTFRGSVLATAKGPREWLRVVGGVAGMVGGPAAAMNAVAMMTGAGAHNWPVALMTLAAGVMATVYAIRESNPPSFDSSASRSELANAYLGTLRDSSRDTLRLESIAQVDGKALPAPVEPLLITEGSPAMEIVKQQPVLVRVPV